MFDRLGVFPASFDEAAAVAVCASDGVRAVGRDRRAGQPGRQVDGWAPSAQVGATRYQLLETLRHFARDRAGGRASRSCADGMPPTTQGCPKRSAPA